MSRPAPKPKPKTKVLVIKKKAKGHAHHGGAWKVAYADFVTAMMALFMVLWLVSQTDETTRSDLSQYFRTGAFTGSGHVIGDTIPHGPGPEVGVSTPRWNEQRALERTAADIERALDDALGEDPVLAELREQIEIEVTDEGLLIQIVDGGESLFFDSSSAQLRPALAAFLETMGPVLGRLPNEIQIHGHTDARPFPAGSTRTNWSLSFERADAARGLLERAGLRPGQVVGVLARGASALLVPDDPSAAENRRLSILAVRLGREDDASRGAPVELDEVDERAAAAAAAEAAAGPETTALADRLPAREGGGT